MGPVSTLNPVEGFWPIFFLLVVLKIPVFAALWLIWWASKAPEPEAAAEDSERRLPAAGAPTGAAPRPPQRTLTAVP